ncbi:MAG: hypothetical protein IID52_08780 [Proteobacteria bacterium]|nr:hypothetical protein [Pseudomonadota bacterium]
MWYGNAVGLKTIYERICEFEKEHGDLWKPSPLLKRLAEEDKTFVEFDKERVAQLAAA